MICLNNGFRYCLSRLNDDEKQIYESIVAALLNYETRFNVGKAPTSSITKAVSAVFWDNPLLFYPDKKRIGYAAGLFGTIMMFSYNYSEKETERILSCINDKLDSFEKSYIKVNMKPLAKQIEIHRYLQKNVKTAALPYDRECFSVVGSLVNGYSVCEGFAGAYKLLCDKVHLPSLIVSGTAIKADGTKEPHAWNITRINGITSHIDVTWDTSLGVGSYDYFNLTDDEIAADHIFDRSLYPACNDNSLCYFSLNRLTANNLVELKRIIAANANKEFFSVKLNFGCDVNTLSTCRFPAGNLRFNEARNIVMYSR